MFVCSFVSLAKNVGLNCTIPTELALLTRLTLLHLDKNILRGTIPAELAPLTQLISLHLDKNLLRGTIPTELGNLSLLKHLEVEKTHSQVQFQPSWGDLPISRTWILAAISSAGPLSLSLRRSDSSYNVNTTGTVPFEFSMPPPVLAYLNLRRTRVIGDLNPLSCTENTSYGAGYTYGSELSVVVQCCTDEGLYEPRIVSETMVVG